MSAMKDQAIEIIDRLQVENRLDYNDYCAIYDGLEEIDTLRDRDTELEELWEQFGDVPMDLDTECIEESFLDFPAGTNREDVWRWFDQRHSKGVAYLMYKDGVDRTPELAQLCYLKQLCTECDSETCIFNPDGICKFQFVCGRAPGLSDDGCADYRYREER